MFVLYALLRLAAEISPLAVRLWGLVGMITVIIMALPFYLARLIRKAVTLTARTIVELSLRTEAEVRLVFKFQRSGDSDWAALIGAILVLIIGLAGSLARVGLNVALAAKWLFALMVSGLSIFVLSDMAEQVTEELRENYDLSALAFFRATELFDGWGRFQTTWKAIQEPDSERQELPWPPLETVYKQIGKSAISIPGLLGGLIMITGAILFVVGLMHCFCEDQMCDYGADPKESSITRLVDSLASFYTGGAAKLITWGSCLMWGHWEAVIG